MSAIKKRYVMGSYYFLVRSSVRTGHVMGLRLKLLVLRQELHQDGDVMRLKLKLLFSHQDEKCNGTNVGLPISSSDGVSR
jgi:hypothetical protein